MKGGVDTVRRCLSKVLPELWDSINHSYFDKLIESMPKLLSLVIEAKCGHINY